MPITKAFRQIASFATPPSDVQDGVQYARIGHTVSATLASQTVYDLLVLILY